MGIQSYRYGIKPDANGNRQMPEPFRFFWGSAAIGVCGIVAMADKRVGIVLAWGLLIGAGVIDYNTRKKKTKKVISNANPSASQVTYNQNGTVLSQANVGVKKP